MNKAISQMILNTIRSPDFLVPAFPTLSPADWRSITVDSDNLPSGNAGPREVCHALGKGIFQFKFTLSLASELKGKPPGFAKSRLTRAQAIEACLDARSVENAGKVDGGLYTYIGKVWLIMKKDTLPPVAWLELFLTPLIRAGATTYILKLPSDLNGEPLLAPSGPPPVHPGSDFVVLRNLQRIQCTVHLPSQDFSGGASSPSGSTAPYSEGLSSPGSHLVRDSVRRFDQDYSPFAPDAQVKSAIDAELEALFNTYPAPDLTKFSPVAEIGSSKTASAKKEPSEVEIFDFIHREAFEDDVNTPFPQSKEHSLSSVAPIPPSGQKDLAVDPRNASKPSRRPLTPLNGDGQRTGPALINVKDLHSATVMNNSRNPDRSTKSFSD
ncbi:hypothetical protein DFH07DRAFT_783132 [Mycena maculata]|uniref:Uncharacterized protein n=1 Tax=Mycena maculata TaxID=230809 RepID=A0AAD7HQD9_9AGAR|nr:hypothetical protein DFH07DRAFT_783132 [Mycena maculata]